MPAAPSVVTQQFARDLIRRKAMKMARRPDARSRDADDFAQQLTLELLRSLQKFDETRGTIEAFVHAVVANAVAMQARAGRAAKRGAGHQRADLELDAIAVDGSSDEARLDLRLDVEEAVNRLPEPLRDLARRLKTKSIAEVARDLQLPRSTLQRQVDRLREHMSESLTDIF